MTVPNAWQSARFGRRVHLTHHTSKRMAIRGITRAEVQDLIETGVFKRKDELHAWIYKRYPERSDNLVCAALITSQAIIVKTLMTHWQEQFE